MNFNHPNFIIRRASIADYHVLSELINIESQVHRHLDWRSSLDWLGWQPFLLGELDGEIEAVFACPPDPTNVAWIRLFAARHYSYRKQAWQELLNKALEMLDQDVKTTVAAICLNTWFADILADSGFKVTQRIVVLEWTGKVPPSIPLPRGVFLRPMFEEDLPKVAEVDARSFDPLWRNSLNTLSLAYTQSASATVAEDESGIIGYQISTAVSINGHLARLGVNPEMQNKHIGYALVQDLMSFFEQKNAWRITVNTQENNWSSLALYRKMGFSHTGETFDVYTYNPD